MALKEVTDRIPDFEFELICARIKKGLPDTEKIGNVTVHRVGFGSPIDKYLLPILGPLKALRLDGVNVGSSHSRLIWSLMASYGGFASLVYIWLRPKTKMLLTIQEGDPLEHYAKRAGMFGFLHRAIFKRADAVQVISRFLAKWSTDMGFKGEPEIIPNGVDLEKFSRGPLAVSRRLNIRTSFGFTDSDIILVTASRLSLKNAVDDLIKSLVELPENYKALIIGEGEDEEMLRMLVKKFGLESRVVFAGKKNHDELSGLLQASDIFIRASLSEGLGNSFLEAMACGIPIVGTPVGGIPDFLVDGETGVFCEVRNPKSIAVAVLRIQQESGLRERLIANSEKLVREKYDWKNISEQMRKILYSVLNSKF